MNELKRLLSFVRRAVDDYGMIEENDVIAVGVSGGKDSSAFTYDAQSGTYILSRKLEEDTTLYLDIYRLVYTF